jgi:integrase
MPQLEGSVAAACALWLGRRASELVDRQVRDLDRGGTVLNVPDAKTASGVGAFEIPAQLQGYLRGLARGKEPQDRLFGSADRHDLLRWVRRIWRIAGVPQVCTHALRGTWGSLARKNGAALEAVSKALGHASTGVTSAHYVTAEAEAVARQLEVEVILKKANHLRNSVDVNANQLDTGADGESTPDLGSKVVPISADASESVR